jgi:NAD(P)-dependent dehydrogenase (short-subunit alcohol dehydrogenase family)
VVEWLPLAAPGTALPALDSCGTVGLIDSTPEETARFIAALNVHGLTLSAADPTSADLVVLAGRADAVRSAFIHLTALAARPTPPRVVMGILGDHVDTAGVAGLVKTAALEWSAEWKCVTVADDVEPLAAAALELAQGGLEREVRLGRQRAVCIRVAETIGGVVRPLPEGPWVVSGGARGVTATCALALAGSGARRIVLMGRTPLDDEPAACRGISDEAALKRALIAQAAGKPDLRTIGRQVSAILAQREIRATIHGIEAAGAEVRYEPVDVTDAADVRRAVAAARAVWGPIRGLVHGAGVLADKRLGEKTLEQFVSVLRPKLDGVRALLEACGSDPLEHVCFFSSVAAHSGNPGQSDYAAANATLDRLAVDEQARRGAACHVVSIAWGPWDGGMVTESLAKHFTARGIDLIPQDAGARAFVDELRSGVSTQVIIGCGLEQMRDARRERMRVEVSAMPVLEDHRIGDAVVLPMTMALDTLLGEGRRTLGPACELRDLQLLQGLVLADGSGELEMHSDRSPSGDGVVSTLTHTSGRPAYRAEIASVNGEAPPVPAPAAVNGTVLPDACLHPYASALFHGPAFQVIREVLHCTDHAISARLATAGAMGWPAQWQVDPAALDGALQLLRLWGVAQDGRASLPTGIGRCRVWAPWPDRGDVGCTVQCRRDNAYRLSGDALFTDLATGNPLLSLDGIVMHVHAS